MKTFETSCPRLPIPTLEETAERYLKSVAPLFTNPRDFNQYTHLVHDFIHGQGPELQQRLLDYDKTQSHSWLENWWLSLAYLSWRESVLINSNWYIIVQPHPYYGESLHQIKRASGFIKNFLDFKQSLDSQTLPPESTKNGSLCMHQYSRMFGITRVPKPECDVLVGSHPSPSKHILVLVQDQIYIVDVYDYQSGHRLALHEIENQLMSVLNLHKSASKEPCIGLLTGTHRDTWARVHDYLSRLDPLNVESFKWIESALFAVALDEVLFTDVDSMAKNTFHSMNGHNRWFDKSLTIVVTRDGHVGLNGEHSPCDALVPAMLVDYAVKNEPAVETVKRAPSTYSQPWQLHWKIDHHVNQELQSAQEFVNKLIKDSDLGVLHYKSYGSDYIKKNAQVSPDAFMQICLQLTYYRLHRQFAPTYETASTRKFSHGRTETCRSLSSELVSFIKDFESPGISKSEKFKAFRLAADKHVEYLTAASNGKGVDRHLLGLRLVLKQGETKHPMFTHPVFTKSSSWILSTSALFSGERVYGTGFGTVEWSGYGMNYLIASDIIKVGIESKFSCLDTCTQKYKTVLTGVLNDMKSFLDSLNETKNKSKL